MSKKFTLNIVKMNSIRELFEETVNRTPEKELFIFQDKQVTYKACLQTVNKVANGYLSLGVKKGDKVSILLPNCLEFPYTWLAANMIGAVIVPVNCRLVADEIKYILNHSEAKLLVTSDDYIWVAEKIKKEIPMLKKVINIDNTSVHGSIHFCDLLKKTDELRAIDILKEDLAAILYTSGTTGKPKGCMATHDYFINLGDIQAQLFQLTEMDRVFTAQPFYYMDPQWNTIMVMMRNATLVFAERFSTSMFWEQIRHYNITCFYCIGSMTSFLFNNPPSELDRQHQLRIVQTSGIPSRIHKAWEERFNVKVYEIYASTETTADIAVSVHMDRKVGTACIGRPVYYRKAKIVDENDIELPPNEIGEIILERGKGMMKGYYKDPKATEHAFRGGWFHSGDLGYVDEDGDFHFVGRKKEIIRRSGENISATSIEQVLMNHPKIIDVAAVPVPDKIRGEEIKVYIVLKPNERLTYEQIIEFCEQNMATFKVPRYIEFRDSLPRTPSERVQKQKLIAEKADLTECCFDRMKDQTSEKTL
jgi:crotonobetaine/carnitine-CoA ligase